MTTGQAFAWLSQLRHRWDDKTRHCYVNICDAQFQFSYEYLGNTNRLVITPLTDRYICVLHQYTQTVHCYCIIKDVYFKEGGGVSPFFGQVVVSYLTTLYIMDVFCYYYFGYRCYF